MIPDMLRYPHKAYGGGNRDEIDVSTSISSRNQRLDFESETLIAFSSKDYGNDAQSGISPTLRSMNFDQSRINGGGQIAITSGVGVRRLTPRECERLQGYPDDFTRWDANGYEIADSVRYRMLGNSIAVPCVRWIAGRIAAMEQIKEAA